MITLYIFKKDTGIFDRIKTGMSEQVINSLDDNQDFTLVAPPDYEIRYKWNGSEWIIPKDMMESDNPEEYDYSEGWDVVEPSN